MGKEITLEHVPTEALRDVITWITAESIALRINTGRQMLVSEVIGRIGDMIEARDSLDEESKPTVTNYPEDNEQP